MVYCLGYSIVTLLFARPKFITRFCFLRLYNQFLGAKHHYTYVGLVHILWVSTHTLGLVASPYLRPVNLHILYSYSSTSVSRAYRRNFNIAVEIQKYKPTYYILKMPYIFVVKTVRKYELAQSKHTAN